MRLGFWPPVYGNWIMTDNPEQGIASYGYVKETTLLAERVGIETFLLQFHPALEELERFSTDVMPPFLVVIAARFLSEDHLARRSYPSTISRKVCGHIRRSSQDLDSSL